MKVQRNEPIAVQDRTLVMSHAERKKPGINKSKLCYQKWRVTDGKRIHFYGKEFTTLTELMRTKLSLKYNGFNSVGCYKLIVKPLCGKQLLLLL
jgi:hypothetical protein